MLFEEEAAGVFGLEVIVETFKFNLKLIELLIDEAPGLGRIKTGLEYPNPNRRITFGGVQTLEHEGHVTVGAVEGIGYLRGTRHIVGPETSTVSKQRTIKEFDHTGAQVHLVVILNRNQDPGPSGGGVNSGSPLGSR